MALASPSAVPNGAGAWTRRRALTAAWIVFGLLLGAAIAVFGWVAWRCVTATLHVLESLSRLSVVVEEGLAALEVAASAPARSPSLAINEEIVTTSRHRNARTGLPDAARSHDAGLS